MSVGLRGGKFDYSKQGKKLGMLLMANMKDTEIYKYECLKDEIWQSEDVTQGKGETMRHRMGWLGEIKVDKNGIENER